MLETSKQELLSWLKDHKHIDLGKMKFFGKRFLIRKLKHSLDLQLLAEDLHQLNRMIKVTISMIRAR